MITAPIGITESLIFFKNNQYFKYVAKNDPQSKVQSLSF